MLKRRFPLPLVVAALLIGIASFTFAAGPGAPERGIPYQGWLELDGAPVEVPVSMTFRLYDDAVAGSLLWEASDVEVAVSAGRFSLVLGAQGTTLPETVFTAAELFLEVELGGGVLGGRQQIFAAPQAVRAGHAYQLNVSQGHIYQGAAPTTNPASSDLGLYSGTDGKYVRLVSTGGQIRLYNDGQYGASADLIVSPGRVETPGNLKASGNVEMSGDLKVGGAAFGGYQARDVSTNYAELSNGFVVARAGAGSSGPRCVVQGKIAVTGANDDGLIVAEDSLHNFTTSDTVVPRASITFPVPKGTTWRVNVNDSAQTCAIKEVWWVPFAP